MMKKTLLGALLALAFTGTANATVVTLNNTYDITGSGTALGPFIEKTTPPADWYGLKINGGNAITTIDFSVFALTPPAATLPTVQFRLYQDADGVLDSSANVNLGNVLQYWNVVGAGNTTTVQFAAGVYAFQVLLDPTPDGVGAGGVSSVPLPAAAWLFGSALFGAGALRRKQVLAA